MNAIATHSRYKLGGKRVEKKIPQPKLLTYQDYVKLIDNKFNETVIEGGENCKILRFLGKIRYGIETELEDEIKYLRKIQIKTHSNHPITNYKSLQCVVLFKLLDFTPISLSPSFSNISRY